MYKSVQNIHFYAEYVFFLIIFMKSFILNKHKKERGERMYNFSCR